MRELKPGGKDIVVTERNKDEYVKYGLIDFLVDYLFTNFHFQAVTRILSESDLKLIIPGYT